MQSKLKVCFAACLLLALIEGVAHASTGASIVKSLGRYFVKETSQEVTEQVTKKVAKELGEEVIERVAQKIIREGNEKALAEAGELIAKHGPNVVRAIDNLPDALPVLTLLKELPAEEVSKVTARLAAGRAGQDLAKLGRKLGTSALRAEAKHPGLGSRFAQGLGTEGAELSVRLSSEQAIQVGRHVKDISKLPATQQSELLSLISKNAEKFSTFVGRFVEKNPGKVFFTTAGTALILAESERILGGDEIAYDANGIPHILPKPGLAGRLGQLAIEVTKAPVQWMLYLGGSILVCFLALHVAAFGGLELWKPLIKRNRKVRNGSSAQANR